jgi:hypothetical protein
MITIRLKKFDERSSDLSNCSISEALIDYLAEDTIYRVSLPTKSPLLPASPRDPHRAQQRNLNGDRVGTGRLGKDGASPDVCNDNARPGLLGIVGAQFASGLNFCPFPPLSHLVRELLPKFWRILKNDLVEQDCDRIEVGREGVRSNA